MSELGSGFAAPEAATATATPEILGEVSPSPPPRPATRELRWSFLGRVPYREAVALQEELRRALRGGAAPRRHAPTPTPSAAIGAGGAGVAVEDAPPAEHLLLLEHPHVYTLGRNASAADVLASAAWLRQRGIEVEESDRGGQVTYHGPGQLVGYPILDLSPDRRDVRRYVRDLEEVLIRTLAGFGIAAEVRPGAALIGVWAGGEKIAAIGVHLSRWITTHGFALNVAPDLSLYGGIVPCGLRQEGVTSMARLLGTAPPLAVVAARLAGHFADVFARRLVAAPPPGH
ncbi:MAG TPA: lipoyl(octanoyl) transferase LipB [Thermoanaerobaculia bacterium]|nr:lipoyl(octanoyl) transferase LipB [Thermoanaerobaculia bacterium]